jgi:Methyltransferase domain
MHSVKGIAGNALRSVYRKFLGLTVARFDSCYLNPEVPLSGKIAHSKMWQTLADVGNHSGMRVLEIGSREVTGVSTAKELFSLAEYVGFDYYAGPNVDVVGDAHQLSNYFDKPFDLIFTSAVFEHLAMPWVVATEIAGLLKVGGYVFVETHFSFMAHERPWHFFQFSDMALRSLFSPALGFECVEAGMSNPIVARFSALADEDLRYHPISGLYCHSEFLGRKFQEVSDFDWNTVRLDQVVGDTKYPLRSEG